MTASPPRSDYRPPSDPAQLRRWLLRKEQALANVLARDLTALVQRTVRAFEATLPSLTASGDFAVFDEIPVEWLSIIDGRLLPEIEQIFLSGGITVSASVPAGLLTPEVARTWADIVNEAARAYVGQRRNLLVGVGDSLFQGVMQQVERAITTGASTENVKQALEQLGGFSEFRADTIARTEILTAYSNGNWQAAEALGEYKPVEKMWLATIDARTREDHAALNGVLLPWDEPFDVGGEPALFPQADGMSVANAANCRCLILEFWPGDIRPDGTVVGEDEVAQIDGELLKPMELVYPD